MGLISPPPFLPPSGQDGSVSLTAGHLLPREIIPCVEGVTEGNRVEGEGKGFLPAAQWARKRIMKATVGPESRGHVCRERTCLGEGVESRRSWEITRDRRSQEAEGIGGRE